jgi:hypothetical protein
MLSETHSFDSISLEKDSESIKSIDFAELASDKSGRFQEIKDFIASTQMHLRSGTTIRNNMNDQNIIDQRPADERNTPPPVQRPGIMAGFKQLSSAIQNLSNQQGERKKNRAQPKMTKPSEDSQVERSASSARADLFNALEVSDINQKNSEELKEDVLDLSLAAKKGSVTVKVDLEETSKSEDKEILPIFHSTWNEKEEKKPSIEDIIKANDTEKEDKTFFHGDDSDDSSDPSEPKPDGERKSPGGGGGDDGGSSSGSVSVSAPIRKLKLLSLNPWEKEGLDILNDSSLLKQYNWERTFKELDNNGVTRPKFDLEPETFNILKGRLILKSERMAMRPVLTLNTDGASRFLLEQSQLVGRDAIIQYRDTIWKTDIESFTDQRQYNLFSDHRLKLKVLGDYLEDCLTSGALRELESTKEDWKVTNGDGHVYNDGAVLFWHVANLIKPNNDALIDNAKEKLRKLNVKNFDNSVIKMLTIFENIVNEIANDLGGEITESEKMTALWKCLETMKDANFSRVVSDEKRIFRRELNLSKRKTCRELMLDMKREEVNMKADDIWNKPTDDQKTIVALQAFINQTASEGQNAFLNTSEASASLSKTDKSNFKAKREWMFKREGEETTMTKDDKLYHWCSKHKNPLTGGKGQWVRHKESEHREDFVFSRKPEEERTETKKDTPAMNIDRKLLAAIKDSTEAMTFLSSFGFDGSSLSSGKE